MKRIKNYFLLTIALNILWCILNESFSLSTILQGFIIGIVTLVLVNLLFLKGESFGHDYSISFFTMLKYIIILFYNIYKSAISMVKLILFEEDNPIVVEINTKVQGDWGRNIIANSITLTPGTVTIDQTGDKLTVLWMMPAEGNTTNAADEIQGHFEKVLY